MKSTSTLSFDELLERFDAVLLDAYGVLVDADGALPRAASMIEALEARQKRWFVVTNDASRSPETCSRRFNRFGLPISPERVISSGMLLRGFFAERDLIGAGTVVLGPRDTHDYVRDAGGRIIHFPTEEHEDVRVVVIGDEAGFPLLDALDSMLGLVLRRVDRGAPIDIVVPNPDLIYPKAGERYGFAAGSFALMLEHALQLRAHDVPIPSLVRLGKPYRPIFLEALERAGCTSHQTAMIGDQLETDVRGANAAGIASVLVTSGITRAPHGTLPPEIRPRFLLV